ncbi:MAG: DNA repair protein RadC [Bacteroidales bacterium]|nr:DNA repair protein RadC [Bacteroidales bacterium]
MSQYLSIKEWNEDDRPREKMLQNGVSSLSDAELLAILIGSGSRNQSAVELCKFILADQQNDINQLARLSVKELTQYKGIGEAKAISIVAALELAKRRNNEVHKKRVFVSSSQAVYDYMSRFLIDLPYEEFWVLFLNRSNTIIDKLKISQGGISGTVIDSRLILKEAILRLSSSIILVHNHPSEQIKPSEADKMITKKIKEGAGLMDIQVLDHLIIGGHQYYSFADEGLI